MSHREDPQGCLLNQLPESQNSNLKRESRYPERKKGKADADTDETNPAEN